jgi:peptide-methionine (S)-S-oxide reductase
MSKLFVRLFLASLMIAAVAGVVMRSNVAASEKVTTLPKPAVDEPRVASSSQETAVVSATSGYSGGAAATAEYETVSTGMTNHAESVKIVYDPSKITYGQLLQVFFSVAHDPTELNRQGPDSGTQYRSVIFFGNEEQKKVAQDYIAQLDQAKVFSHRIVTQVVPLKAFYPAEGYHQNYAKLHPDSPYIARYDLPKVANLQQQFPQLYHNQ